MILMMIVLPWRGAFARSKLAPIVGAAIAGVAYRWLAGERTSSLSSGGIVKTA
ncbi:MAG TPA: hypothetical protein VFE11_00655 [Dongiaceae bacterium]|nr:hypothetical protein [Dongiaceae bacterium]